jgi:putative Mn2+ efflux pump MntP
MDIIIVLLIAIGLSMDAFAVSIASGFSAKMQVKHGFRMAVFFGAFQMIMPVLGWMLGLALESTISAFNHWIAFGLLLFIGAKMIYESFRMKGEKIPSAYTCYCCFQLPPASTPSLSA